VVVTGIEGEGGRDEPSFLAREVAKGDDSLILRDAKGAPAWNWKH